MKRALLGGTFDPPHLAHLVAGEAAFRALNADVVTFVPAGRPWQKAGDDVTAASHRWAMTQLATEGVEYFEADDREVHRDGWTYTADTLASFDPGDEIWLILGADAALGLPTWNRYSEVVERARLAIAPRPGIDRRAVDDVVGEAFWLDMPELGISGTEIRRRARSGGSLRFLVREGVWEYAVRHNLYAPVGSQPV